jgi:hypothetical protein
MVTAISSRLVHRVGVLGLALALAAPLHAQRAAANTLDVATDSTSIALTRIIVDTTARATASIATRPALGASIDGVRAGVHAKETGRPSHPNAAATHANLGQARAMMIVGAAALVTGAIIGDTPGTIIMVGGAVVGLVGLYDYLQ